MLSATATPVEGPVTAEDIERAERIIGAERTIRGSVRETPLVRADEISRRVGRPVTLKAENLQRTGSFKLRGATTALTRISAPELTKGVVAASAGNHAQAVALAAHRRGSRAELFMPVSAPLAKLAAVRGYGGTPHLVEGTFEDAEHAAREFAEREAKTLIPPFDDPEVIAGQGTVGLEIARQGPLTKLVVVPMGGGALACGIAIAVKSRLPGVRVVGVQAEACAAYPASLEAHRPIGARVVGATICDGLAVKRPGELTLPLVERWVDDVVTVSDDEVAEAMVLLLERSKLVAEGAGAVSVAALMHGKVRPAGDGDTCAVVSGGNVDASRLAECIHLGETSAGRRLVLSTVVPDRPGALASLLRIVAEQGANVLDVEHLREGVQLHVREAEVRLVLQTDGRDHGQRIADAVAAEGFAVGEVEVRKKRGRWPADRTAGS